MELYTLRHRTLAWVARAFHLLMLVALVALVAACDEEKPADGGGSSGGGSSSLMKYADNPCALLPEEDVRAVIPTMPADAEHYTGTKRMKVCQYSWPGDRKGRREVMGREIEYVINDSVCLKWLRVVKSEDPLARFRNSYKAMTAEEKAKMKAAFQKELDKKVAAGEISRDGKKLGEGMTGGMVDSLRFEVVDGVGTAAAWGGTKDSIGLKVLDRDTEFEIAVNVYADDAKNREASIALAKKILGRAK